MKFRFKFGLYPAEWRFFITFYKLQIKAINPNKGILNDLSWFRKIMKHNQFVD